MSNCTLNIDAQVCIGKGCGVSDYLLQQRLRKPQDLSNMNILQFLNSSGEGVRMAREGVIVWGDVGASPSIGSKLAQPVAGAGYMFFAGSNITDPYAADMPTRAFTMSLVGADAFPRLLSVANAFDCPSCVQGLDVPIHQGTFYDSLRRVVYKKVCSIIFRPFQLYAGPQQVLTFVFEKLELLSAVSSITLFDIKNQMLVRVFQGPMRYERFSIQCLAPCNFTVVNGATWRNMSERRGGGPLAAEDPTMVYEVRWSTRRGVATDERVTGHRDCLDYCPAVDLQACYQRCLRTRREEQTFEDGDSDSPLRGSADKHASHVTESSVHAGEGHASSTTIGGPEVKGQYGSEQAASDQRGVKQHHVQDAHENSDGSGGLRASVSPNKAGNSNGGSAEAPSHLRANNGAFVLMQDPVQHLVLGVASNPEVADSCDFSQKLETLMFPMERVQGEIIRPIQGGWVGVCKSSTRCPVESLCKSVEDAHLYKSGECQVALLVNGSTLIKHVWGCPHTPARQGMSTGVVVRLNTGNQVYSPQTNAAVLTYNEFQIYWTQSSADQQLDITRWGAYTLGVEMPDSVGPGARMQIQFAAPFDESIPRPSIGRDGAVVAVNEVCCCFTNFFFFASCMCIIFNLLYLAHFGEGTMATVKDGAWYFTAFSLSCDLVYTHWRK
jgi:hypothetical protein